MTSQINKIDHDNEINQDKVKKALDMLAMINKKDEDRLQFGSDYIYRYVEDVEGDWLENWGNNELSNQSLLREFLNQNYQSVKRVKELLGDLLEQFTNECESYLNLADEDDKIFQSNQIKLVLSNYLGYDSPVLAVRGNNNSNHLEQVKLLELVEDLLEDFDNYSQTVE